MAHLAFLGIQPQNMCASGVPICREFIRLPSSSSQRRIASVVVMQSWPNSIFHEYKRLRAPEMDAGWRAAAALLAACHDALPPGHLKPRFLFTASMPICQVLSSCKTFFLSPPHRRSLVLELQTTRELLASSLKKVQDLELESRKVPALESRIHELEQRNHKNR